MKKLKTNRSKEQKHEDDLTKIPNKRKIGERKKADKDPVSPKIKITNRYQALVENKGETSM
jgi:hypothetical protein